MCNEPRIIKKAFSLVGAESPIDFGSDFGPVLFALYQKVTDGLSAIRGLAEPVRMVGYWHVGSMPDGGREYRYFAGVEADIGHVPEGLIAKQLPESLYAVFTEQKRGEIGSPGGYAYKVWLPASGYTGNGAIPGDFEIFQNMTELAPDCEADIYIPIQEA